jgi:hypothetical protein
MLLFSTCVAMFPICIVIVITNASGVLLEFPVSVVAIVVGKFWVLHQPWCLPSVLICTFGFAFFAL